MAARSLSFNVTNRTDPERGSKGTGESNRLMSASTHANLSFCTLESSSLDESIPWRFQV